MHLLALIVPAVVALVFFVPSLAGATFLSDDYLLVSFLDPETGAVQWPEIRSGFGERWFLSSAYWRPLVSLSYGVNIGLFGCTPVSLNAVNLLLHLVMVMATAELCYRLGSSGRHPVMAAIFGGVFVALHPVSPEPVLWIAARTTSLEVGFRMCAVAAFAVYLRSRRKTTYGLVVLFSALALMSKESAVVLPVYLLFVDLLDSPRRPARERLRLHAPLFVLWLGYALVRLLVLGRVLGIRAPQPGAENVFTVFGHKLATLLAPDILAGIGWLWFVAVTVSLVWGRFQSLKTLVPLLGLGALCLVLSLAPTYNVPLGEGTVGVRMLYGSLPVVAVLACRCLFTGPGHALHHRNRRVGAGCFLVISGMLATSVHVGRYEEAWSTMRRAEGQIAELGNNVETSRPLGLVSVPPCWEVPGPVNPVTYFAFGRRPFTSQPFAIVGLGCLIAPPPISVELINDPRPVHALLQAGHPVAAWDGIEDDSKHQGEMRMLHDDSRAAPGRCEPETGTVTFDPPRSLATIEQVRILATGDATGGRLELLEQLGIHFSGGVRQGEEQVFDIDVSRHRPLLAEILRGTVISDLKVDLHAGRILDVQVSDRLPRLELHIRLDGLRVGMERLEATLMAPTSNLRVPMRIVLLGESIGFTWTVEPGAPVSVPLDTLDVMRELARRIETSRYHYYFQTTAPQGSPGSARSDLDWFALDVR